MTNKQLKQLIKDSGLKKGYLSKICGMNRVSFSRKLHGFENNKFSEIQLSNILKTINK